MPERIVVLGACVLDIQAQASSRRTERGSTVPGVVTQSPGGVGRNIAEAYGRLHRACDAPLLISILGDDAAGRALLAGWKANGYSTSGLAVLADVATPTVVFCFDPDGAVASGIAAVESFESAFSAAMLHRHSASLSGAQLIVLEANLPAAVIEAGNSCKDCPSFACPACAEPVRKSDSANGRRDYGVRLHGARDAPLASMIHHGTSRIEVCQSHEACFWYEPVSTAKAARATAVLDRLDFVSPNAEELVAMSHGFRESRGLPALECSAGNRGQSASLTSEVERLAPHIQILFQAGVKVIMLTLGAAGAACCRDLREKASSGFEACCIPALPAEVANTAGAGDCLAAGACIRLAEGSDPVAALAYGMAAAHASVESSQNVPTTFNTDALLELAARLLRSCVRLEISEPSCKPSARELEGKSEARAKL